MKLNKTGVYKILCPGDKFYIGSTDEGFDRRWKRHLKALRKGLHPNTHLQHIFNKHGEGSLQCVPYVVCTGEYMKQLEQKLITQNWEDPLFINQNPYAVGGSIKGRTGYWLGRSMSEESKAKMRGPRVLTEAGRLAIQTQRRSERRPRPTCTCGSPVEERYSSTGKFKRYLKTCGLVGCKARLRNNTGQFTSNTTKQETE